MNTLVFGSVLLALVSTVVANRLPEHLDGVPLDPSWLSGASRLLAVGNSQFAAEGNSIDDTVCSSQYSCIDCRTARVCRKELNGSFTELMRVQCPSILPYCDTVSGSCSTDTAMSCSEPDANFICSKDGYFPDPSNSSIYHICKGLVPHKFECSDSGKSYNALTKSCDYWGHFSTFNCGSPGTKNPYTFGKAYFGYCQLPNNPPAIVDKCPGFTQLNATSQLCETMCDSKGIIADSEDCSKYYKCDSVWVGSINVIVKERKSCPSGTTFNYVDKLCIDSATNDYCATDVI